MKLERPLIFFDLETTGINVTDDRIIQIGISKITPDGEIKEVSFLINPRIPIPPQATAVHGITDNDVAMAQTFKEMAPSLYAAFKGCDLGGFNIIRFDLPMLAEHFLREKLIYPEPDTKFIDAMKIFHHFHPRNLESAYAIYCDKSLGDMAHDASADAQASREVFFEQLIKHKGDMGETVTEIHDLCMAGQKYADFDRKLKYNEDGEICYAFGKWKDYMVIQDSKTIDYARWMLTGAFTEYTKQILRTLIDK